MTANTGVKALGPKNGRREPRENSMSDLDVLEIFDRENSFKAHANDDEHIWNAIAILGEKKGQYLVEGTGVGKPWPDSWIQNAALFRDFAGGGDRRLLAVTIIINALI
ncbi:hypothetical protein C8R45DRAFT_1108771 [Mycena sanguinolenta]|nr:hypothetical protein C8R45DRAFT_1108771 [Mycena sanguinolenta]